MNRQVKHTRHVHVKYIHTPTIVDLLHTLLKQQTKTQKTAES